MDNNNLVNEVKFFISELNIEQDLRSRYQSDDNELEEEVSNETIYVISVL
ncbi:hypothetical protein J6TS2_51430 [Heyndrickxia sporothermodurans]|nr:hypothetical protein J6TS2_51430 [Heyndrickxia sporothermodurans]